MSYIIVVADERVSSRNYQDERDEDVRMSEWRTMAGKGLSWAFYVKYFKEYILS